MKAAFLDRDGVINEDLGYVGKIENFKFKEGIFELLKLLQDLGFALFVVTNQSGIARGFFNEEFVKKTNEFIIKTFNQREAVISDYFFCPHHPDDSCKCRKPETGMILKAKEKYNIDILVDATHPFAINASKNAIDVCKELDIKYVRFERKEENFPKEVVNRGEVGVGKWD